MAAQSLSALRGGGRTFGSGSRALLALLSVAFVAVLAALLITESGSSKPRAVNATARADRISAQGAQPVHYTSHPIKTSGNAYGYVPAWLGKTTVPVGRVVTATPSHPRLAIQGDTLEVQLGRVSVLATVSGPTVPEEGRFPIPKTSPSTFTVTFVSASAPIALTPKQFATIDEEGRLHTLRITTLNGGPVPSRILAGESLTLKLYAVLPVGEGRVLWAPISGKRPVVQWDFDVEID